MSEPLKITIPDIGDFESVDVIEVLVAPGGGCPGRGSTDYARKR